MTTDFFDQQHAAHRQTGLLVGYFVLAVILIILSVYAVITAAVVHGSKNPDVSLHQVLDPARLSVVAVLVLLVILSGSLYKIAALREGGAEVARMLGGELINPGTLELGERRLLNVVEEMALASGVPVPSVYVLKDEHGINAFAAGFEPGDAVIGVSQGAIDYLTRDELQGVIGHEFSHLLNGDMRLNLRLIGLLHGILLIALIGELLMRWFGDARSSRRSKDDKNDSSGGIFLLGLALFLIGYLGLFFGRLIKAAISRQREFLADASSVQFTRNPSGIVGALKKIGGLAEGSKIRSPNAEQACHLFFGQGVLALTRMMATHPPLDVRIRRIDPSFDGTFPPVDPAYRAGEGDETPEFEETGAVQAVGFVGESAAPRKPERPGTRPLDPGQAVASIGAPREEHVEYASALLASFPEPLTAAAREPFGARAVVYAALIDADESIRQRQIRILDEHTEAGTSAAVLKLLPLIKPLGPAALIPLVDLALPALRQLSRKQYATFRANIEPLVLADQRVSLFEFALRRMLLRHLDQHFGARAPAQVRYLALTPLLDSCSAVLSTLAHLGNDNPGAATHAFAKGLDALEPPGGRLPLLAPDQCSLAALDPALDRLASASPRVKKRVLDACAACIAADGWVTAAEGELLRAIADSLDCPMPPLLTVAAVAVHPRTTD